MSNLVVLIENYIIVSLPLPLQLPLLLLFQLKMINFNIFIITVTITAWLSKPEIKVAITINFRKLTILSKYDKKKQ